MLAGRKRSEADEPRRMQTQCFYSVVGGERGVGGYTCAKRKHAVDVYLTLSIELSHRYAYTH
jgi:hypothetical protein